MNTCNCQATKLEDFKTALVTQKVYASKNEIQQLIVDEFLRRNPCACKAAVKIELSQKLVDAGLYASLEEVNPTVVEGIL